ncbi:uncharacterized protein N7459_005600 [Penicillium hispanicum]|uniref:uncharacterized protein n=1 Tax=Penicillium hispanicum TaxID=1080232 RepID=UPI0025404A45|nr:uncharacterized protein N7459_005600 [Penicillium hispanicum]KAJ5579615.1 hypothetical protein N7459_005600 [Penicillium hispanicum]
MASSIVFPSERTFRSYDHSQGAIYAQRRPTYHPNLYQTIISHHILTGGELDTILNVGCGPGNAVCDLAPQLINAIGVDASEGMIRTARLLGDVSWDYQPILFGMSTAEGLGSQIEPPIPHGSVDLVIAATAVVSSNACS